MTSEKRIEQLEAVLRGVLGYVKASNPRSLSAKDVEAKALAILYIETVLNPPAQDAVEVQATAAPSGLKHPLNSKMGQVVE